MNVIKELVCVVVYILLTYLEPLDMVIDWSQVDKEDYLFAMERSVVRDKEIKALLKDALTTKVNDRQIYMKGIDASYNYEGYSTYKTEDC